MIDRLRRLFNRKDPLEDLVSAYVDAEEDSDLALVEESLRAKNVNVDELRTVRETSRMLNALNTVEAPGSYALTPETLTDRGYSEKEIEHILNPSSGWKRLQFRNATMFVPLAIAVLALTGVALLTIGDLSEYVTDRWSSESQPVSQEMPELAGASDPAQTVLIEAETFVTVEVEMEVQAQSEMFVQTIEVEKETIVVEREIVEEEVPVAASQRVVEVAVEKVVEVEKVVALEQEMAKKEEMEIEIEKEVEAVPTPPAIAASEAMGAVAMMTDDALQEPTPTPTVVPCVVVPTPTPTPPGSPSASETPDPVMTVSPIPTCTPTPSPTPSVVPTETMQMP